MSRPTRTKEEVRRDLIAITSQGIFIGGPTFASIYVVYLAWLFFTGTKPDDAITTPTALLLGLTTVTAMLVSGSLGGLLWVFIMRPFLSRAEIEKWLNYGMKSSAIARWNVTILDRIYKGQ